MVRHVGAWVAGIATTAWAVAACQSYKKTLRRVPHSRHSYYHYHHSLSRSLLSPHPAHVIPRALINASSSNIRSQIKQPKPREARIALSRPHNYLPGLTVQKHSERSTAIYSPIAFASAPFSFFSFFCPATAATTQPQCSLKFLAGQFSHRSKPAAVRPLRGRRGPAPPPLPTAKRGGSRQAW